MLTILRLTRPLYILLAALAYILGLGLARYLGIPFDPLAFWLGLLGVLLSQTTLSLLSEVFRPNSDPILTDETLTQRNNLRDLMLYLSLGCLGVLAVLSITLYNGGRVTSTALLFVSASLLLSIVYGVPPMRLIQRGFGELTLAAHLAYVIPSIGFLLQAGEYHRLLGLIVFPLTALALACFLILDFPSFAQDRKYNRGTLLVRIGWERALPLHNGLLLLAYLSFLSAPIFGFSLSLLWPAFLTLPFAVLQAIFLRNVANGGRPVWNFLTATAIAIFGLTVYFLTFTFWTR